MKKDKEPVLECIICKEFYDIKDRKPLVLLCGHTFCKQCMSKDFMINKRIRCSFCPTFKGGHIYKTIDDIGVNYGMQNQVEAMSKIKVEEDKNDKQCKKHPTKFLDMFCVTDNIAICSKCLLLKGKGHQGHDVITEEEKIERDI